MKKIKAFSLLEIAVVITIIGVLMMSVFKGQQILQKAKIEKTITQIEGLRTAIDLFSSTYYDVPGSYSGEAFDGIKGEGNNVSENDIFWKHLELSGIISSSLKSPAIGGVFFINNINGQNYIILAANKAQKGLLTKQEAVQIKSKIDGNVDNNSGAIKIIETNDSQKTQKRFIISIEFP